MCIICAKPAGVPFPSNEYIKNMWEANDDGAGIMWTSGNKVHIKKGFMKYKAFKNFLKSMKKKYDMKEIPVVMHFRITTHGGTKPQNTHPFPVTSKIKKLQALEFCTDLGVAHNGTIAIKNPPEISDTMAYISQRLVRIRTKDGSFYTKKPILDKIEKEITSKMCFLDNRGNLTFIGDFVKEKGVYYSNTSYLGYSRYRFGKYGYYDYSYYDDYDSYDKSYDYMKEDWYRKYYDSKYGKKDKYEDKTSSDTYMQETYFEDDWYDGYGDYSSTYDKEEKRELAKVISHYSYKKKRLMEIDGYIYNNGELKEGTIFIDSSNHPYMYDYVEDVCIPAEGIAYLESGLYAHFNESKSVEMLVKECIYVSDLDKKEKKIS